MRIRKDYTPFVPMLIDLRKLGMQKRQIISEGYLNSAEYKAAARMIADSSMELSSEIEETAPETVETQSENTKAEKPKPPRLTKIVTRNLDLEPGKVHRLIITSAQDDTPNLNTSSLALSDMPPSSMLT